MPSAVRRSRELILRHQHLVMTSDAVRAGIDELSAHQNRIYFYNGLNPLIDAAGPTPLPSSRARYVQNPLLGKQITRQHDR